MKKKLFKRLKDKIKRKIGRSGRAYNTIRKGMERFVNEKELEALMQNWKGIDYKIKKSISSFSEEPDYDVILFEPSWPHYDNSVVVSNIRDCIINPFIKNLGFKEYEDRWAYHTEKGKETVCFMFLKSISDCNITARKFIEGYLRNREKINNALKVFCEEYPTSYEEGNSLVEKLNLKCE